MSEYPQFMVQLIDLLNEKIATQQKRIIELRKEVTKYKKEAKNFEQQLHFAHLRQGNEEDEK